MSQPAETTTELHQEDFTSAAIDGARIACVTAQILVSLDGSLTETQRVILSESLLEARGILDVARETMLPRRVTSVHIVGPGQQLANHCSWKMSNHHRTFVLPDAKRFYAEAAKSLGTQVKCLQCGSVENVDPAECLQRGWPKCCGQTMTLLAKEGK